jgi:hypothetical protein
MALNTPLSPVSAPVPTNVMINISPVTVDEGGSHGDRGDPHGQARLGLVTVPGRGW